MATIDHPGPGAGSPVAPIIVGMLALGALVAYVVAYVWLMDRQKPAWDGEGRLRYPSSFRFASIRKEHLCVDLGNGASAMMIEEHPQACWANVAFLPVDALWHRFADAPRR